jgi:hypothetical protein
MKRREFIWVGTIAALGVSVGGYVFFSSFERLVRKIIFKDTQGLSVSSEEITKFLLDTRKTHTLEMFSFSKKELIKWSYYLDNPLIHMPYEAKYNVYRSQIVGLFLLSTDFFQNKMDPKRPIHYVKIYNPYFTPCSNPFSNLYYPES